MYLIDRILGLSNAGVSVKNIKIFSDLTNTFRIVILNLNYLNLNNNILKKASKYGKKAEIALGMWTKLARAASTFGKLTSENIRSFGLTEPQFSLFECLGHLGPLPLGELSRKQLVSGGNTTCVVDNLEKLGLVERVQSQKDRRVIVAQLTPKGEQLFAEIFPKHAEFVGDLASVLTNEEQESLSELLKKLGCTLASRTKNGEEYKS
jgi:MarR family transcriptional regulator, 2-MHQ and catechol-resistance regulon repressor